MYLAKIFSLRRQIAVGSVSFALALGSAHMFPVGLASGGWIYVSESPNIAVTPNVVTLSKGAKVTIAGSGFKKGEELGIRLMMGGVLSDIRHQVKPTPNVNESGAFYSEWVLGNESRLLDEGATTLNIVNSDGDVIAHAPIVWVKAPKKESKQK